MIKNEAKIKILDCYEKVFNNKDADIYLLWGGRDKGASDLIAQRLVIDCLQDDFFRCVLIRKTYESIKDSQYQTIKDVVYRSGLSQFFTFLKSPLEIHCNINNNKILARGCDNPDKLKSLKDCNVCHIEEADQISENDYVVVHTTLRHESARIRQWLSFNSDFKGDYKEHWIWKYYLGNIKDTYKEGLYSTSVELPLDTGKHIEQINFYSHHRTYKQNPFCPNKRAAVYESYKSNNTYYYNVYTKGILGKRENKNKWAWALRRDKHFVNETKQPNLNYPISISFDFNHDPCVCIVGQEEMNLPHYSLIAYIKASSGKESALTQLCDRIKTMFPHHYRTKLITITGDASGTQRDPSRPSNINRYTDICNHLGLGLGSVSIEKLNISHKSSRDLCNDVLFQIPKGGYIFYAGNGCELLINEIESAYPDDKESLNKFKKDKDTVDHGVDAWRYLNQLWFAKNLKGVNFKDYQKILETITYRLRK